MRTLRCRHRGEMPDSGLIAVDVGPRWHPRRDCIDLPVEEVVRAVVGAGVSQLRHGFGLDLADPFPREIEVLSDLFECPGRGLIEPKAEPNDRRFSLIEWSQEAGDLIGEQGVGCVVKRRDRVDIRHKVSEIAVALVTEGLRERERLRSPTQRLDELLSRQVGLVRQFVQVSVGARASARARSGTSGSV